MLADVRLVDPSSCMARLVGDASACYPVLLLEAEVVKLEGETVVPDMWRGHRAQAIHPCGAQDARNIMRVWNTRGIFLSCGQSCWGLKR